MVHLLLVLTLAAAAAPVDAPPPFYYDLGPDVIDVAAYPEEQQKNYRLFQLVCSQCHTTARPLNHPTTSRWMWQRYVAGMRRRAETEKWLAITAEDVERIVDFLTFDAEARKNTAAFEAAQTRLIAEYERVQERYRKEFEKDLESARQAKRLSP